MHSISADLRRGASVVAATAAVLTVLITPVAGAGVFDEAQDVRAVLVIEGDRSDRPVFLQFRSAFQAELRDRYHGPVDVFAENLDLSRFGREGYWSQFAEWLASKYRGRRIDVVVAAGPIGYAAVTQWRDQLWPDVPVVFTAVDGRTWEELGRLRRSTGLLSEFGHIDTIRMALDLIPGTRNIAFVGGPKDHDRYSLYFGSQISAAFEGRLEIIDLSGLPMAELQVRVAGLPKGTIIMYTNMTMDGAGRSFTGPEALALLAPRANAPFFSHFERHLGAGIVGGHLFDASIVGRETAALVVRVLDGASPESIDPKRLDPNVVAFDWRELERWHIPVRRLPPGSSVEFRPPSQWREHRNEILAALVVFTIQGSLILTLLRSRNRRRRVNRELHQLSGRLITAQEDERRRVARELHDDISQRLALLAMECDSLPVGADSPLEEASSKVHDLARDVHAIAHNLHPARLDSLGLAAELEVFCGEIEKRQDLRVKCRLSASSMSLPPEVALALYRVAQEAVQNAVRHSGADEVVVELADSPRWASLTVADDGRGLEEENFARRDGLGITGMRERMRLVGGWLNVDGEPGSGTTVSAWVPLDMQPNGETADDSTPSPDR